jgi:hypothetical protein
LVSTQLSAKGRLCYGGRLAEERRRPPRPHAAGGEARNRGHDRNQGVWNLFRGLQATEAHRTAVATAAVLVAEAAAMRGSCCGRGTTGSAPLALPLGGETPMHAHKKIGGMSEATPVTLREGKRIGETRGAELIGDGAAQIAWTPARRRWSGVRRGEAGADGLGRTRPRGCWHHGARSRGGRRWHAAAGGEPFRTRSRRREVKPGGPPVAFEVWHRWLRVRRTQRHAAC